MVRVADDDVAPRCRCLGRPLPCQPRTPAPGRSRARAGGRRCWRACPTTIETASNSGYAERGTSTDIGNSGASRNERTIAIAAEASDSTIACEPRPASTKRFDDPVAVNTAKSRSPLEGGHVEDGAEDSRRDRPQQNVEKADRLGSHAHRPAQIAQHLRVREHRELRTDRSGDTTSHDGGGQRLAREQHVVCIVQRQESGSDPAEVRHAPGRADDGEACGCRSRSWSPTCRPNAHPTTISPSCRTARPTWIGGRTSPPGW